MSSDTVERVRRLLAERSPKEVAPGPQVRQAAVAVLLTAGGGNALRILLIKRAEHPGDPWSGQMALPGGRRDPGDETLLATALRETREEVGVSLGTREMLGQLDDLSPVSPHLPQLIVRPFVFGLAGEPPIRPSAEVALHIWAGVPDLLAAARTEDVSVRGGRLSVPGYRVGPHLVWGMTERIITPFLNLLTS